MIILTDAEKVTELNTLCYKNYQQSGYRRKVPQCIKNEALANIMLNGEKVKVIFLRSETVHNAHVDTSFQDSTGNSSQSI